MLRQRGVVIVAGSFLGALVVAGVAIGILSHSASPGAASRTPGGLTPSPSPYPSPAAPSPSTSSPAASSPSTSSPAAPPVRSPNPTPSHVVPASADPFSPSGMLFDDEFNAASLNTDTWVVLNRPGDASNSEQECYQPDHVGQAGGLLSLRTDAVACSSGQPYTSGAVQMRTFSFLYGTLEFRAKESGGTTWPAIWLLGANCQRTNVSTPDNVGRCAWPNPGSDEIDVTEVLGGEHGTVNEQIHSGSNQGGCKANTSDVSLNWHVYGLVWTPGSLVWKIDGVTTCTVTSGVPATPMFLIINTALGGAGGSVDSATLPQVHQVDYVRITRP